MLSVFCVCSIMVLQGAAFNVDFASDKVGLFEAPGDVVFTPAVVGAPPGTKEFLWDFGDGRTAGGAPAGGASAVEGSATHRYLNSGAYDVRVVVSVHDLSGNFVSSVERTKYKYANAFVVYPSSPVQGLPSPRYGHRSVESYLGGVLRTFTLGGVGG